MAATNVVMVDGVQPAVTTAVALYTSPSLGGGTRITAVTAVNPSASTETYTVYVGGSATDASTVLAATPLSPGANASPPEVVNQMMNAGESLWVKVSNATTITFRMSGLQF